MTNINRRFFDELAAVLRSDVIYDREELIHDIAEVLQNNCPSFQTAYFIHRCGVAPVLKLGSGTRVVPLYPSPEHTINSNNSETKE